MGAVTSCFPRFHQQSRPTKCSNGTLAVVASVAAVSLNQNTASKDDASKLAAVTVAAVESPNEDDSPNTTQNAARIPNVPSMQTSQAPEPASAPGPAPKPPTTTDTTPNGKSNWSQAWDWCTKPLPRSSTASNTPKSKPHVLLPRTYPAMPPTPSSHVPNHPSPRIAAQLMPIDASNSYIAAERAFLVVRRAELRDMKRARWEAVRREARWSGLRRREWEGGEKEWKTFVRHDLSGRWRMVPLRTEEQQGEWVMRRVQQVKAGELGVGIGGEEEEEEEEEGEQEAGAGDGVW